MLKHGEERPMLLLNMFLISVHDAVAVPLANKFDSENCEYVPQLTIPEW